MDFLCGRNLDFINHTFENSVCSILTVMTAHVSVSLLQVGILHKMLSCKQSSGVLDEWSNEGWMFLDRTIQTLALIAIMWLPWTLEVYVNGILEASIRSLSSSVLSNSQSMHSRHVMFEHLKHVDTDSVGGSISSIFKTTSKYYRGYFYSGIYLIYCFNVFKKCLTKIQDNLVSHWRG